MIQFPCFDTDMYAQLPDKEKWSHNIFTPNNISQIPFENVYGIIDEEWHFFQTQTSNYTLSDDTNIKQNFVFDSSPKFV